MEISITISAPQLSSLRAKVKKKKWVRAKGRTQREERGEAVCSGVERTKRRRGAEPYTNKMQETAKQLFLEWNEQNDGVELEI